MVKCGLEEIFMKFLHAPRIYLVERRNFDQKYKFSNKNNMVSAWRNFKNIFPRPLFIIIFRPEMLKFHPYSIFTRNTRVEFVIYCVLSRNSVVSEIFLLLPNSPNGRSHVPKCGLQSNCIQNWGLATFGTKNHLVASAIHLIDQTCGAGID